MVARAERELFLLLRKHLSCLPERVDAGRNARVDRHVDEDLTDLLLGEPIGQRPADMQFEFMRAVEDRNHCEIEHAALFLRDPFTAPAGTPAVLADELLEWP